MTDLLKFLQENRINVKSVEEMLKLEVLNLSYNKLTKIRGANSTTSIGNLINLKSLFLTRNDLTIIPPEIGNLINLEALDLLGNDLTTLPPEIGNLINLKYLNLSYNKLTNLPLEIGNLINLKDLDLSYNKLTNLPKEIGNLRSLNYIGLIFNYLTTLPLGIDKLPKDLFLASLHKSYDESVKFRKAVKIIERTWIKYDWVPNSDGIARCALRSFRELQESNPEIFS